MHTKKNHNYAHQKKHTRNAHADAESAHNKHASKKSKPLTRIKR